MYSIIKDHIVLIMVGVSSCANLYSRVLSDIMLKYFSHIIVEYIRVRACVHTNDSLFKLVQPARNLLFHKGKVRHRFRVVILQRIGVQADKFHITCDERKVGGTEYRLVCFCSRPQAIMVSDKGYIRHVKSVHDIPLPEKLFG